MDCIQPKGIANPKTGKSIRVRCGKCLPCKQLRAGMWTIRLTEHIKQYQQNENHFVTLTLADENLTWGYGDQPTLSKRDVQLFFKKLRKMLEPARITYYAVGEYGEKHKRPHYHALIYGTGITERKTFENILWLAWKKGHVHVDEMNESTIRYVSGYLEKGLFGETDDTIQREFNMMSKGIGINYVHKNQSWHEQNNRFDYPIGAGQKTGLPRYYRDKIFSPDAIEAEGEKRSLTRVIKTVSEESLSRMANFDRLRALKQIKHKRN